MNDFRQHQSPKFNASDIFHDILDNFFIFLSNKQNQASYINDFLETFIITGIQSIQSSMFLNQSEPTKNKEFRFFRISSFFRYKGFDRKECLLILLRNNIDLHRYKV